MSHPSITAKTIRDLLVKRYPGDKWALRFEVRDQTGFHSRRNSFADAIAMHRWPSHTHVIHGFEIKTTRGDWQRELAKPDKAERIMVHCDHFWLVAPDGVHIESELPPLWGYMRVTPKALRIVKDAPRIVGSNFVAKLGRHQTAMDRGFVASLMRNAEPGDTAFQEAIDRATVEIRERHGRQRDFELENLRKERDKAREWSERFQTAFGGQFDPLWSDPAVQAGRVKAAMRLAEWAQDPTRIKGVERTVESLLMALRTLQSSIVEPMGD